MQDVSFLEGVHDSLSDIPHKRGMFLVLPWPSVLQRCCLLGSHRTAWELSVLCNPAKINNLNLSTQPWYKRLLW